MTFPTLAERIQHTITHFDRGNLTAFARRVGLAQSTLYRNLKGGDEQLLLGLVGWILLALPELSRRWLLLGEGEMLLPEEESVADQPHDEGAAQEAPAVDGNIVKHLYYIIECQKHTLEMQAKLLEIRKDDFLKNAPAPGGIDAVPSVQLHNR